ncbi:MAG: hypothetical protein KGY70_16260, partial [Bacteroidales bacterium]|nr:hypothetical protein [Bacteroidales bacterium]
YRKYMSLALMGIMAEPKDFFDNEDEKPRELTEQEKEEIRRRYERKKLERMKRRGMKEFEINGVRVLALNYKNALRKYNNAKDYKIN